MQAYIYFLEVSHPRLECERDKQSNSIANAWNNLTERGEEEKDADLINFGDD